MNRGDFGELLSNNIVSAATAIQSVGASMRDVATNFGRAFGQNSVAIAADNSRYAGLGNAVRTIATHLDTGDISAIVRRSVNRWIANWHHVRLEIRHTNTSIDYEINDEQWVKLVEFVNRNNINIPIVDE